MDPLPNNAIAHFTYPGHPLEQLEANTEYVCGVCKTNGSGKRYRCNECAFDLHEYCRTCPESLSSFMHPCPLSRVGHNAQATRQNKPVCVVCGDHVEGLFYRCEDCEFNLHPICTLLPQSIRHALHPAHPLTLQSSSSSTGWCAICRGSCCSWRYRCGACGFDIHLECLLVPCHLPTQRSVPLGQPRPPGPPPQCSIPSFGPSGPPPYGGSGHGMPFGYGPPGPPPYSGCGHEMPFGYSPPGLPPYGGYGHGMPSGPPPYGGYAHGMPFGYGPPGPPPYSGCGHEMPFRCSPPGLPPYGGYGQGMPSGQPPYGGYGHGMPSGPPPYGDYAPGMLSGHAMPFGYSPPGPPSYGNGMTSGSSPYNNGNHQTPTVGGTTNGIAGKMFRIVGQLLIGVATNAIFGLIVIL